MKAYYHYSLVKIFSKMPVFMVLVFWGCFSYASTGEWSNDYFTLKVSPEPGHWSAQSSLNLSWSFSSASTFSHHSGYQYLLDNDYSTSVPGADSVFTLSTVIQLYVKQSGTYYFHLWPVSSGGMYQQPVTTIGPIMIDLVAPDTTEVIPLPDIKLLNRATTIQAFTLSDYAEPSTLVWSWQKEENIPGYVDNGLEIENTGTKVFYQINPAKTQPGQTRILYTAENIINTRSIVQLSHYLWNKPFPPFIFKRGKLQSPGTLSLNPFYEAASYPFPAPEFKANSIFPSRLKVKLAKNSLALETDSTLNTPLPAKVQVRHPYDGQDEDTQLIWAYENLLENGDFSEEGHSHWAFEYSQPSSFQVDWRESYSHQTGVLKVSLWNSASLKWVQDLSTDTESVNPFLPVHGGSWYTLRARIKTENPEINQTFKLEIDGYAGYGGVTTQRDVAVKTFQCSTEWTYYELSWYARTNLAAVVMSSQVNDNATTSFYLDEMDLIEKKPDALESDGARNINVPNAGFDKNLSSWSFQRESSSIQSQDTGWRAEYHGRKGIGVLNPSTEGFIKLTQFMNLNPARGNYKFRVWCATDAAPAAQTPFLVIILNTFDARTQVFKNVLGTASFNMKPDNRWQSYDFACPVEDPVIALQIQARNLQGARVYLDKVEVIKDTENPSYWNHEKLDYWEMIQKDTTEPLFFQLAESHRRYVPVGGNFHVYANPFGMTDDWWNPYSEDSFSPLWLDSQMEAMENIGCNAFKITVLIHDVLPDKDIEFGDDTVSGEFPSIQSPGSAKIPSRYLDRLDQIIAMAHRHHLRVILTLPFNYQTINWWLKNGGNYGEGNRIILADMWNQIVSRYREDPAVLSYSFNVEHWIQMREWGDTSYAYRKGPEDYYFHSPVTEKWQQWLMGRYTTLGNLNTAWSQIPVPFRKYAIGLPYSSFTEIPFPGWDGQNTIGSSLFTGGMGGGEDPAHYIPMAPVRLDDGTSNHLFWKHPDSRENLVCYYLWRQEKGKGDAYSFGTTWHLLQVLWGLPTTFTDTSESYFGELSSYRYEVTGGNPDAWRSWNEGTPENENASYDPMLYDFIRFREFVVDGYNYAQSSAIKSTERFLNPERESHLVSLGLAQFNYLYRWPSPLPQWGDGASMTPEGPQMTLGYNLAELPKSLDVIELSYYTGFPLKPWTPLDKNPGVGLQKDSGQVDETSIRFMLQYLRLLLRGSYWNPEPDLRKPVLLKEFAGEGEDLYLHNLWNNLVLDYTQGEVVGWMVWFLQDGKYGLWDNSGVLTPWGNSLKRRMDDLKNSYYPIPSSDSSLYFNTGISTTGNWMFLLTSSHYRDEDIPTDLETGKDYFTLGKLLKAVRDGDVLPSDHWDIQVEPDSMILRKPEF